MPHIPMGKYISILYRAQLSYLSSETKEVDIGGGQLAFVFTLYDHPGCSQDDVASILEIDKTTVTRAVLKMEKSGIIERKRDVTDMRVMRLYLTDKGVETREELKNVLEKWYEQLTIGMSEAEIMEINRLMTIMTKNAKKVKSECINEKEK